jgi:hypothetical protein
MIICVISAMAQAIDIVEEMHQKTILDTQVSEREGIKRKVKLSLQYALEAYRVVRSHIV